MSKLRFMTMIFCALLLMGCSKGVPYNSNSGDNGSRITASELQFDAQIEDSLSAITGDNEDWFYFIPPEDGEVDVFVILDTPSTFAIEMALTNSYGNTLQEKQSSATESINHFDKLQVTKDRYFISLKTTHGEGKYSLKVEFKKPEVITEQTNEPQNSSKTTSTGSCVPADKCKSGQKCCKAKTTASTDNTDNKTTNNDALPSTTQTITATVVLSTPRGDGLSDIKLNGIGKNNNVKPGMKAILRGLNRKVNIYQCMNVSCLATVNATKEELNIYDTVDVYIE